MQTRAADGRVPGPHPRPADLPRRALPGRGRGAADDPDQPDLGQLLLRRHLDPDRGRRRAGHGEAARGAADDAQLRGLPEVTAASRLRAALVSELNLDPARPARRRQGHAGRAPAARTSACPTSRPATSCAQAVDDGTELGAQAKEYMDARRPGARRGDHRRDRRAPRRPTTPRDGFILDGFPRTIGQAEALDGDARRASAATLTAASADRRRPTRSRAPPLRPPRRAPKTGHIYHVEFDPPKHEGVCDVDGAELILRDDDKPEVDPQPPRGYHEKTEPLSTTTRTAACCTGSTARASPTRSTSTIRAHARDAEARRRRLIRGAAR